MYSEKLKLWQQEDMATLTTYCLDNSEEFKNGEPRPAVIVCPGGAYLGTSDREAEPVAMRFLAQGFHAFVLRYNTYFKRFSMDMNDDENISGQCLWPKPLIDLAEAIRQVRSNAQRWHVDPNRIYICGFSAGGNLVGNMATQWHEVFLKEALGTDNEAFKPNGAIMGYPVADYFVMREMNALDTDEQKLGLWKISNKAIFGHEEPTDEELQAVSPSCHVSDRTAPTFVWHTAEDGLVYAENAMVHALALSKHKVPYELHVFEKGGHGLSLCDETTASEPGHVIADNQCWVDMAVRFLNRRA